MTTNTSPRRCCKYCKLPSTKAAPLTNGLHANCSLGGAVALILGVAR